MRLATVKLTINLRCIYIYIYYIYTYIHISMSLWQRNNLKSKVLLNQNPDDPKFLRRRGLALFAEDNFQEAGKLLERAVMLDNKAAGGNIWYALGKCRHVIWEASWDNFVDDDGNGIDDRLEEVVGAYRRALAFPEMLAAPKVFFAVGRAYEDYGSFEGAMQMYSHVLTGFPSWEKRSHVVMQAGSMCRHPRVNALDQAIQYFEYLIDDAPPPYTAHRVQFVLAGLYQRQGRVSLAKDMFEDCLKKENDERKRLWSKQKKDTPGTGKPTMLPKLAVWIKDPEIWRERARFHFNSGMFPLAVDDMSQALRLASGDDSGMNQHFRPRTKPEWEDWELLAISLGRITEKESALKALERAFKLNPYREPVRLRSRISRWDPEGWGIYIERQNKCATRIQAVLYRGWLGRSLGTAYMEQERQRRQTCNRAATTIQLAWRFYLFRLNFRRQRELIEKSLTRIARQKLMSANKSWLDFVALRKYHRKRRSRAATSIQLWQRYEIARAKRKARRAENRRKVAKSLRDMRTRIKRAVMKAWEGWVIWIIEVKEPYHATWIQVWWRHLKWSAEFHRKRNLIMHSLNNIRLNFTRRLFAHMLKVVRYTRMVRINRRQNRLRDRIRKCFASWKWWTHEFLPSWAKKKERREKERYYAVKQAAFRLVDKNDLRVDPRNEFNVLGLASIGVAMGGGRDAKSKPASHADKSRTLDEYVLDRNSTEAKLIRIAKHPVAARKLRRSLMMYDKVCKLWREYYANRDESVSTSFMHARLPKDAFDRASIGSNYYQGTVQTSLMKQELDRFRLTKVPLDIELRRVMPGPRNRKPKTTVGTLGDAERESLEAHFVQLHRQAIAETKQRFGVPARLGIMALTLPNALRKNVHNFENPWPVRGVKQLARLTGKNTPINPFNLKAPPKKEAIVVDHDEREEQVSEDPGDDEHQSSADMYEGNDPAAILRTIIRANNLPVTQMRRHFGPPVPTTNRLVWGFPDFESPGLYGVEGTQKKEDDRRVDQQIANSEWAKMAKEEIEQREIDAKRLRNAKEADYLRFRKAALVGGPMDPLDFFCALRPGRMYEQRAYVSAARIQLWALIFVPCRYNIRLKASIQLQRAARGMLARRLLATHKKVKYNVMRILMRLRDAAFRRWHQQWHTRRSAIHMAKRLLNKELFSCYQCWVNVIKSRHKARLEKVKHVMQKLIHAKLYRHFDAWAIYIPHVRKLRRLMWKVMASNKLYYFDLWAYSVEQILQDRKELACAVLIQRLFRGWIGRRKSMKRRIKFSKIARLAQRIVRGHIGRVKAKLRRKRLRDARLREAKEKRIRELRGSYNDRVESEKLRREVEQMFVEDAVRAQEIHLYDNSKEKRKIDKLQRKKDRAQYVARLKVKKSLLKERRNIEKSLAKEIKTFCRDNSLLIESLQMGLDTSYLKMKGSPPGDIPLQYILETGKKWNKRMTRNFIAHRWIRAVGRSQAAMTALRHFRKERPPPNECELCLDTWATRQYTESHHKCPKDRSHFIYSPASFYEFGLAEAGGINVNKEKPKVLPVAKPDNIADEEDITVASATRTRRMSSYM